MSEKLEKFEGEDARKTGDIATLEKSWEKKLTDQAAEYQAKVDRLSEHTTRTLVDNVAQSLASKISTAPALILPHIKARLQADFDGDEPKTRVLDGNGQPSALTIDDLAHEFIENKDFAAIITGSKASGGAGVSGGGAAKVKPETTTSLATMNPAELAEHIKASKTEE